MYRLIIEKVDSNPRVEATNPPLPFVRPGLRVVYEEKVSRVYEQRLDRDGFAHVVKQLGKINQPN